jgi:predicted RND superfamily exporter protein
MKNFEIEEHSTIDKSFGFGNDNIYMYIDYDDVDHIRVDAALETVKYILNTFWNEDMFKDELKKRALKQWFDNEYNLQSNYESIEEYLDQYK